MQASIHRKLELQQGGLYLALIFPIAFSFILTFAGSRIFSAYWPQIFIEWSPGLRVHHFAYGFMITGIAGYLSLIFSGPRAKFWIALLLGFGLGLAFDEFGMWLHLGDHDYLRWQYDGFVTVIGSMILVATMVPGIRFISRHMPFQTKKSRQRAIAQRRNH